MGKTVPPPQEGAEGPYRLETPDAFRSRCERLEKALKASQASVNRVLSWFTANHFAAMVSNFPWSDAWHELEENKVQMDAALSHPDGVAEKKEPKG
jgi:hypothetical protein